MGLTFLITVQDFWKFKEAFTPTFKITASDKAGIESTWTVLSVSGLLEITLRFKPATPVKHGDK